MHGQATLMLIVMAIMACPTLLALIVKAPQPTHAVCIS